MPEKKDKTYPSQFDKVKEITDKLEAGIQGSLGWTQTLLPLPLTRCCPAFQIYENAMITAGLIDDPRPMVGRLNQLLVKALERH